jgi:hypothetical protein
MKIMDGTDDITSVSNDISIGDHPLNTQQSHPTTFVMENKLVHHENKYCYGNGNQNVASDEVYESVDNVDEVYDDPDAIVDTIKHFNDDDDGPKVSCLLYTDLLSQFYFRINVFRIHHCSQS